RAALGHLHGLVRQRWRLLSLLVCRGARLRPNRAGGRLRSKVPPDGRGAVLRHPAAAEEDRPYQHHRHVSAHEVVGELSERIEALAGKVAAQLKASMRRMPSLAQELAYEVEPAALLSVCRTLRDREELKFEMLMDLAGVDYLEYRTDDWQTLSATRSGFSRAR